MPYSAKTVPKIIYALWLQGEEAAPPVVRLNFARWAALNPGYRLVVLAKPDVERLLAGAGLALADMPAAALSDIVRAKLLSESGGIWVDASLFPLQPLDAWLPAVLNTAGFFAFTRPGPDRLIASWFLVASPENPLLQAWWREVRRFWAAPRQLRPGRPANPVAAVAQGCPPADYPYFWFHYLFQYIVETVPEAAEIWQRCIKASAGPPHALQSLFANGQQPDRDALAQAIKVAPVQKLDWRVEYPLDVLAELK